MIAAAPAQVTSAPSAHRPVVCQVLHTLQIGGAEVLAARLARRLSDRFKFVFACLDELGTLGAELRGEGFTVEVLGRKSGLDVGCVRRLAGFACDQRANLLHAHQYTPFFYARAPGWIGRRPPVMFTEHGRFYPDLPNRKRMVFNRLFLRRNDRVVAVGESVKRALINNEGIPASRIEVIYNGVRMDEFQADARARQTVRAELGLTPADRVAILVARLDYLKDHSTALRTAERASRQIPGFRLLLVGEGPERPKIEAEIDERGLHGTVLLLGLRTDVRRLLTAADVFLLTSISEGIPVTLIEAMGAELPVVATAVGGVAEVVLPEQTGVLAPSGDDAALAAGLVHIFHDRDAARGLGIAGRRRAIEMFSEEEMHESYAAAYRELLLATRPAALAT
jgi:glycosyltransferase involved in cell wall biosynthesis